MRIRIRGPSGQSTAMLSNEATVKDLKSTITQTTSITNFEVKYGYPPRLLDLTAYPESAALLELQLDGEQLTISEMPGKAQGEPIEGKLAQGKPTHSEPLKASPKASIASSFTSHEPVNASAPLSLSRKKASDDPPEIAVPSHAGTLVLRVMPDDNSCLFRAFNSAYFGIMDNMHELRSIIAQNIQASPEVYSAAILDRPPDDYCRWIQSPDSWGGSIELQILSQHFNVEICSIDVQTLRVDRYNEGSSMRCILVYSGIHYDVVALSPSEEPFTRTLAPPEYDSKVFETSDDEILEKAKELCKVLQSRGYFTDTAGFNLCCKDCGTLVVGEKGALEHARSVGHTNFGEA